MMQIGHTYFEKRLTLELVDQILDGLENTDGK